MDIMNSVDRFEHYKDKDFEANMLKIVRRVSLCLAVYSLFVFVLNLNILPNNAILTIFAQSSTQSFYYFSIIMTFLLLTSSNKKVRGIYPLFLTISTILILLAVLSFLHLFGVNQWMIINCGNDLFGLYNMVVFYIFIWCLIKEKYVNIVQIFALINILAGFGGLLYFFDSSLVYSKGLHFIVYHIMLSIIFMLIPSGRGIFKSLTYETEVSKTSLFLAIGSILGLMVVYVILEALRGSILAEFKHVSVVSAVISLTFIVTFAALLSKRLVSINLQRQNLEEGAIELKEAVGNVESLSKMAIVFYKDGVYKWTDEAFSIFEIDKPNGYIQEDLIYSFASEESKKLLSESYKKSFVEAKPNETFTFEVILDIITNEGNKKYLDLVSTITVDENKQLDRISGLIEDITEETLIKEDLNISLRNQEILLKEVHHRVKNNLQIILSLLNLELKFNNDDYEALLKKTRNRIASMATIHEQVYNSSDVAHVRSHEYIELTLKNLFNLYGSKINLHLDIDPYELHMDKAIPLGLILNELGLNSIKYAFDEGEEGNFYVKFVHIGDYVDISIWDDGKGLPEGFDPEKSNSLGFTIVKNLVQQLDAESSLLDLPKGFGMKISFKSDF